MTKDDLIKFVSDRAYIDKEDAKKAVEAVFEGIKDAVKHHEMVTVRGFGTFKSVYRKGKVGRNISAGTLVEIPACHVVKFVPSKDIKTV